jgi:alanyl-tRNA synthetase
MEAPFIYELVGSVVETLGNVYPEIVKNRKLIEMMIQEEEAKFHETIHRGMGIIEEAISKAQKEKQKTLPGDVSFKLYDTFGFPIDLIEVIAKEHGLAVDLPAFEALMEKQRLQSSVQHGSHNKALETISQSLEKRQFSTNFVGYDHLHVGAKLIELFDSQGKGVHSLEAHQEGYALFDVTPFYAESGGQVGDRGSIHAKSIEAKVLSTFKIGKQIVHKIKVEVGPLENQKPYTLDVDSPSRKLTAINHTATHLLHAALRKVLGERIKQAGSLVEPNRLRFDFTYPKSLTAEELSTIESLVNAQIENNLPVSVKEMNYDEAMKTGALAFFDEKYGDKVRVVKVGTDKNDFSIELCGGTHLNNISEIGVLKILSESSVASGVRRIEAITAVTALRFLSERNDSLNKIENLVGTKSQVADKLEQLMSQLKQLQKENEQLKLKVAQFDLKGEKSETKTEKIHDVQCVLEQIHSADAKILRALVDQFRDKLKEKTIVVLASQVDGKVSLCAGLTKDLIGRYDAGKIVKELAPEVGGSGGGRADFAQAGGTNPEGIPAAFSKFRTWLKANP